MKQIGGRKCGCVVVKCCDDNHALEMAGSCGQRQRERQSKRIKERVSRTWCPIRKLVQVLRRGLYVLARQATLGEKPPVHAASASQIINHAVQDNLANLCTVCCTVRLGT